MHMAPLVHVCLREKPNHSVYTTMDVHAYKLVSSLVC